MQLAEEFDVRVLVPMVTLPDDVGTVKELVAELAQEMQSPPLPPVGAMIENPAVALSAREIARPADFFSFGTNDLTQYVFAADRDNAAVDRYFDDGADAISRLLEMSQDDAPGAPLTVCGELAGRPEHIPRLLQCGIRAVSVAPPLVPIIKEAIRGASCNPCPTPLTFSIGDSP